MNNTVIKVENLSKQYRLGLVGTGSLGHDLNRWWAKLRGKPDPYLKIGESNDRTQNGDSEYVWALKDINFEVKRGEVLGIIGRNGAGKSTLLKILSRVTAPTTGNVKVKGRIASLLEVGTGFHPELTGRENIYLNGAINGMTKSEVTQKLDEIVDFSGCERYIDTPVKRYSSGMTVRLGFSVAAYLEPEILIVDEVLAVGDAEFQKKCIGKMKDVAGLGRTVLFVSHNMAAVENLCGAGLLIEAGMISFRGFCKNVVDKYIREREICADIKLSDRKDRYGSGGIRFKEIVFVEKGKKPSFELSCGCSVTIFLYYERNIKVDRPECSLAFYDLKGNRILYMGTRIQKKLFLNVFLKGKFECKIDRLPLLPGEYLVNVALDSPDGVIDHIESAARVNILPSDVYGNGYLPPPGEAYVFCDHHWKLTDID